MLEDQKGAICHITNNQVSDGDIVYATVTGTAYDGTTNGTFDRDIIAVDVFNVRDGAFSFRITVLQSWKADPNYAVVDFIVFG